MNKIVILTILLSTGLFAAKKDPVIATVNGVKIKQSEFDKKFKESLSFVSNKPATQTRVLNSMIDKIIGIQRAKKEGLDQQPVVKEKMEDVLYHAQISKELEPKLKNLKISESDIKNYYKYNKEYRTSHILVRLSTVPTEAETKEGLRQALKVHQDLKFKPKTFSKLANKYSQSSTAPGGGDLGFQPSMRLAPEYLKAVKSMKIGEISAPVRSQFGYHIIKLTAIKDYSKISKDAYKKIVYDVKRDKLMDAHFAKLRKSAKIKIEKK